MRAGEIVLRDTDVKVGAGVYLSRQLYNKGYLQQALDVLPYLKAVRKVVGLKKSAIVRLCSIRAGDEGYCYDNGQDVEINLPVMRSFQHLLESITHELVHCRQFQNRELLQVLGQDIWKGKPYNRRSTSYRSYRRQPWEAEAFKLEKPLAKKAFHIVALKQRAKKSS